MNHVATEHRKHRPRGIKRLCGTSDQKNQFSGCGMGLGAGDRRIQKSAATLGRLGRKFLNPVAAERAGLNQTASRDAPQPMLRFRRARYRGMQRHPPPC